MTTELTRSTSEGVFSRIGMPAEWRRNSLEAEDKESMSAEVSKLIPESRVIAEIQRGSSNITFVAMDPAGLKVCQFGPLLYQDEATSNLRRERLNPTKFSNSKARLDHISASGVSVPKIHSVGVSESHSREFIVMEFVRGLGADVFIASAPESLGLVYGRVGSELGKLASVELNPGDNNGFDDKTGLMDRLMPYLEFLGGNKILSLSEIDELYSNMEIRLGILPPLPSSYVHVDPFPVNWHVSGKRDNPKITLMDIEAIQVGHPWIEGIGRALQWAGKDWFSMKDIVPSSEPSKELVGGFNESAPPTVRLPIDDVFKNFLMDSSELFWLPQAMTYELLKDTAEETPHRRKKAISDILKKSI